MADPVDVIEDRLFGEVGVAGEVVRFDPAEPEGDRVVLEHAEGFGARQQAGAGPLV